MITCAICGSDNCSTEQFMKPLFYKGYTEDLGPYTTVKCQDCGEELVSAAEWTRIDNDRIAARAKIDAECSTGDYIKKVRSKLGLSQNAAANLFGGGVNGFSRYERGVAAPSVSALLLLQLLDQKPELLEQVRDFRAGAEVSR